MNVRLTQDDPTPLVGDEHNLSPVFIGGTHPSESGNTDKPHGSGIDAGNIVARQISRVFPSSYRLILGSDPTYHAIFSPLAQVLGGSPVQVGDFVPPDVIGPRTVRQLIVDAAIKAMGKLIGSTLAHERAHSIGIPHNVGDTGEIMDEGKFQTFLDRTGIVDFDPMTGVLKIEQSHKFGTTSLNEMTRILPVKFG